MATEAAPWLTAVSINSLIRQAPSSRLYSVCKCKWTKPLMIDSSKSRSGRSVFRPAHGFDFSSILTAVNVNLLRHRRIPGQGDSVSPTEPLDPLERAAFLSLAFPPNRLGFSALLKPAKAVRGPLTNCSLTRFQPRGGADRPLGFPYTVWVPQSGQNFPLTIFRQLGQNRSP